MFFVCAIIWLFSMFLHVYRRVLGAPRGSFWGPGGSGEVPGVRGGPREVPGGSWGALGKRLFLFFQRWICQWSNEILMFSDLGGFVRRSVVIALCYFFSVFRSLLFAKQWGEYAIKTKCFSMFPKSASSDSNEKRMPKTWFREVKFEVHVDQFWK